MALEFLVSLTENRPAYGRKLKDFPRNIAQLILSMMLEMDEYELAEWNAKVHNRSYYYAISASILITLNFSRKKTSMSFQTLMSLKTRWIDCRWLSVRILSPIHRPSTHVDCRWCRPRTRFVRALAWLVEQCRMEAQICRLDDRLPHW